MLREACAFGLADGFTETSEPAPKRVVAAINCEVWTGGAWGFDAAIERGNRMPHSRTSRTFACGVRKRGSVLARHGIAAFDQQARIVCSRHARNSMASRSNSPAWRGRNILRDKRDVQQGTFLSRFRPTGCGATWLVENVRRFRMASGGLGGVFESLSFYCSLPERGVGERSSGLAQNVSCEAWHMG